MEVMGAAVTFYLGFLIVCAILVTMTLMRNVIKIGAVRMAKCDHRFILLICVYSLVQILLGTTSVFTGRFLQDGIASSVSLCKKDGFSTFFAVCAMIYAVTVWANIESFTSRTSLVVLTVVITLWSVFITVLPFWGIGKYVAHDDNLYCCLNWKSSFVVDRCYFYVLLFLVFVLPLFMMLYGYFNNSKWRHSSNNNKDVTINSVEIGFHHYRRCSQMSSAAVKLLSGIIMMLLWLPYGCYVIYLLLGNQEIPEIGMGTILVALSSALFVPLCLLILLKNFIIKH